MVAVSALDAVVAAPVAFLLGVGVGFGATSRWLIVRRADWLKRQRE